MLLIAFYVDNGRQLPVWKDPPILYLLAVASGCRDYAHLSRSVVASAGPINELALTRDLDDSVVFYQDFRRTEHRVAQGVEQFSADVTAFDIVSFRC